MKSPYLEKDNTISTSQNKNANQITRDFKWKNGFNLYLLPILLILKYAQ